eukprot:GHVU01229145.1.p1 GENE.GHVU01229145.1~~GHVU01229145.1.p1  ORF type:complete len:178 (+),score=29.26 GHVU01229145.1:24-536(+)
MAEAQARVMAEAAEARRMAKAAQARRMAEAVLREDGRRTPAQRGDRMAEAAVLIGQAARMEEELAEPLRLEQLPVEASRSSQKVRLYHRGGVSDGQPHGLGVLRWDDGSEYEGEWRYGERHGLGVQRWKDGITRYAGQWDRDRHHGLGVSKKNSGLLDYAGRWNMGHECL